MLQKLEVPLSQLFPKVGAWTKKDMGYIAHVKTGYVTTFYLITDEDLVTVDERLPYLMDALWRRSDFLRDGAFGNHLEHYVLELALEMPSMAHPVLTTTFGELYVRYIESIVVDSVPEEVQIKGGCYKMGRLSAENVKDGFVIYPMTKIDRSISVKVSDMNRAYPGWQERYETALLLGYRDVEAGYAVFENAISKSSSELLNITFD